MKKFFVKLSLLIVIIVFISQLLRMFLPYMFFTPEYYVKKLKFEEQKEQIDVVFLGTSRTNYGINPSIFEQVLANKSTQKLRTYNLGMAGSSIGEIVALSKQLLNDDKAFKGKYMIVELMPVAHAVSEQFCGQTNIHTNRNAYWASWDMLKFNVGNIMAENENRYSDFRKFSLAKNYATQFVHNQFNMAMFEDYVGIKANHKKTLGQFGLSKKGFRPNKGKKKKGKPAEVQKWVEKSLKTRIKRRREASVKAFNQPKPNAFVNQHFLEELKSLQLLAKEKGKEMIFLVPPLLSPEQYLDIRAIYDKLPQRKKIEITNAKKYPKLYDLKNVYDAAHLNENGVPIYTRLVAEKFIALTQTQKGNHQKRKNHQNKK